MNLNNMDQLIIELLGRVVALELQLAKLEHELNILKYRDEKK
jgi:hypothetical protein